MKFLEQNPLLFLAAIWLVFMTIQTLVMPLLPVDETRYMTVAWEMYHNKSWILPTLNFEAYSHKPPMLFWLINAVWSITGLEVWGVRIMSGLISFVSVLLTYVLAKNLFPAQENIRKFAPLILMASPIFFVFGSLIMFDFLQTIFVLSALIFLVKADKTNKMIFWILFGLMVSLGILAKGPVMLVHAMFPALLAPLWATKRSAGQWTMWYVKLIVAIAIAAVVALIWAIQAAQIGGEAFSNEIFWSQSAGRITQSFAHQKPFWLYVPIIFLAFLPIIVWPRTWKAIKAYNKIIADNGVKFILCWVVPTFITFSLISGKQIHYLIPELGGFSILLACFINAKVGNIKEWPITVIVFFALFLVIQLSPLFFGLLGFGEDIFYVSIIDARSNLISTIFFGFFIAVIVFFNKQNKNYVQGQLMAFVLMSFLLVSLFSVQMDRKGYDYYNLEPLANALASYKDSPIAINRKYQGELGFLGKMKHPIESIYTPNISKWFDKNPNGIVIYRYSRGHKITKHNVVFNMPYKSNFVALVRK